MLFSQVGVTMWCRLHECLPSLLFTSKKQVDDKANMHYGLFGGYVGQKLGRCFRGDGISMGR